MNSDFLFKIHLIYKTTDICSIFNADLSFSRNKFLFFSLNCRNITFILDKNNERSDWMTDLKHTDSHGKKMHVKEIYVIFIHLFDSGILLIIGFYFKFSS
jgi:hypothetical protein